MGILSRGLQGFAQGAGDYMEAELKDEMSERGWLRRQAYLEKQQALVRDEGRAFTAEKAKLERFRKEDEEDRKDLEDEDMRLLKLEEQALVRDEGRAFTAEKAKLERFRKEDEEDRKDLEDEDMRLLKLEEQAKIGEDTRLRNIEDKKILQDRGWKHDAQVKTNFWGYGSQEKFDDRIEKLADIKFGDEFDDTVSESMYDNSDQWLKARSEYMSKVKNELIDGGYETIAAWEQRDRKPTPTPPPTPPPTPTPTSQQTATVGTTQNRIDILNIRKREVIAKFGGLLDFQKDNYIGALLSKLNKKTLSLEELSSLEEITGVKMKDKSSIRNAIKELSGMSADEWKEKLRNNKLN